MAGRPTSQSLVIVWWSHDNIQPGDNGSGDGERLQPRSFGANEDFQRLGCGARRIGEQNDSGFGL